MTDERTLAWMAGILEGEGCIGVFKDPRPNRSGYSLRVSVHNTDPTIVDVFVREFGGTGRVHCGKQREGKRPVYHWYANGINGAAALKALRPYMLSASKTAQADAAILYAEKYAGHARTSKRRTAEQLKEQEATFQTLRALKRA
jgi:hypothetical protein